MGFGVTELLIILAIVLVYLAQKNYATLVVT